MVPPFISRLVRLVFLYNIFASGDRLIDLLPNLGLRGDCEAWRWSILKFSEASIRLRAVSLVLAMILFFEPKTLLSRRLLDLLSICGKYDSLTSRIICALEGLYWPYIP